METNWNVGQLVQVYIRETEDGVPYTYWSYGVVMRTYDDRIEIRTEDKVRIMYHLDKTEKIKEFLNNDDVKITTLFKDGFPVMAKKKLFGGYVIKPV
jgi:hypothetical protein